MRSASTMVRAAGALACAAVASAQSWKTIPPIEAYGQHFFYSNNGSQFYIKGVAYQQDYNPNGATNSSVQYTDPLANSANCARDIPYMTRIFTNTIRVYAIDPTQNHDDCMQQLADAGIYVFADLSEPSNSIQTGDPEWNVPLYERYTSVVNAMSKYNNMAGFFAGNEVVNLANQSDAAAFVKAAVRDTKQYIKSQGYRSSMGVGYATSDVPTRNDLAAYFACGDSNAMIDFWGYNVYSWCGDSSYTKSSYDERVAFFRDYPVPVFFAEYGCNQGLASLGGPYNRPFTEVPVLFGPLMTPVFSGGIVFEYFDAPNQFGLVKIDGNNVTPYPDYTSLSSQLAQVTPSSTQKSNYKPSNTALACPSDATWSAAASPLPPSPNAQFCDCEESTFACVITSDDETQYGDVFNYICSQSPSACEGFQHNSTSGQYGALSGCSPKVQLGWAANQYYNAQQSNPSACDFSGLASVTSPSTASGCSSLLADVASNGSGSVPSPTGSSGSSDSGSDGSAASSSGRARPNAGLPHTSGELGVLYVAAYVGLAFVSGMGMLFL